MDVNLLYRIVPTMRGMRRACPPRFLYVFFMISVWFHFDFFNDLIMNTDVSIVR